MPRLSSSSAPALALAATLIFAPAAAAQYIDLPAPPIPLAPGLSTQPGSGKTDAPARQGGEEMAPDTEAVTGTVMNEKDMLQYCVNISDKAKEARYARIRTELEQTGREIDEKLGKLDAKLAEVRDYVDRREKFLENARDSLIQIFGTMRADAAAAQLSELDAISASAILMKLPAERASTIMNEMSPKQAAEIAQTLIAASKGPKPNEVSQ
jgi:flagellar motility protein MotE (MotC chaperone)